MLVSIIIPAYKQEQTIKRNLEEIYSALSQTRWKFELIVVVDGYVDNTFDEASKVIEQNISVVGYEQNRGKGYAVKFGMAQANGDYIGFIDAGMDISSNNISMLLEHMQWYDADIVVGSKRHPVSKVKTYPLMRKIYSWGYYTMARVLFGVKVNDTQTGIKIFRKEVIEKVLPRLLIKEFAFDIEMLAVAKHLGFKRIYEAPVELALDFDTSSFSKGLIFDKFIQKMVWDTLAVFYRLKILRYYDDGNSHNWLQHDIAQLMLASARLPKITRPEFSIIVTARRVNDFLLENLEALRSLDYPYFEVIMVLDDYEVGTLDLDSKYRVLVAGNKGPGEKRNMGAEASDGNILAFLDDDAFPDREWLKHAADIFRNSEVYALGAPALTPKNVSFFEKMSGKLLESVLVSYNTVYRHKPQNPRKIADYPTVNLFVRKDAFMKVGGFVTEFWPGEDTKLCLDLVQKYGRLFDYDPRPIVYHHRRNVFVPHLKQVSRYGQHRGQFARLFPQTSRLLSYFIPSLFVAGLLVGPIISKLVPVLWYIYFGVLATYLFLVLQQSIKVSLDEKNILVGVAMLIGIISTHLTYGLNFIIGFIRKPRLELRAVDLVTGNYLGG